MKCESKDKGEKKERKKHEVLEFLCTKQEATEPNNTGSESVCSTFTTVNPTKTTPILMKIGDNTTQNVYKHPKFKLLNNIVWFDHKSNFTTHIQSELFL